MFCTSDIHWLIISWGFCLKCGNECFLSSSLFATVPVLIKLKSWSRKKRFLFVLSLKTTKVGCDFHQIQFVVCQVICDFSFCNLSIDNMATKGFQIISRFFPFNKIDVPSREATGFKIRLTRATKQGLNTHRSNRAKRGLSICNCFF